MNKLRNKNEEVYSHSIMMTQHQGFRHNAEKGYDDSNSENEMKLKELMVRIIFLCKVMKQIIQKQN